MILPKSKILFLTLFSFYLIYGLKLFSQEKEERWRGFLSPNEKRISELKSALSEENPNLPSEYHLFFQQFEGDYAIFYDLDGHRVFFRYRRNKWDEENTARYHYLLPGRTFRVKGTFLGIWFYPKTSFDKRLATRVFLPASPELDWRWIRETSTIPVFALQECTESYTERIIFRSKED